MKGKIIAIMTILFLAGSSLAFARDHRHRYYYSHGYHHRHHNDGLGIALGVAGGLVIGSILIDAFSSPPQPPVSVYSYPPPPPYRYQPQAEVRPPRVCYDEQVVEGEWQMNRGRQIWVRYAYPVTRRVQVPCY